MDEVRRSAGRLVVTYRDDNGISTRPPIQQPTASPHPSSPGAVWSQLMAQNTTRLVADIDDLTTEEQQ